ncbi:TraR/DksA C4-type zinc finger protein [Nitrosomonas sp. Nm166]|uniref:TraR/DksA C4-type zinc finger protein n=1 Tax=Nitrosomonas sp. Nm166 TaxID=1881054 RepID=UPI0008E7DBF8|nr:TraR/DksA C4-type zinc finger protein [Nitrosomonas sp. Nm166]SFF13649.1 dksA/traR C4-type zinc finger [Nitrosomonas sp. Nm166]
MKPEDFAQEIELKEYENTQKRAILPRRPSLSHCEDCGEAIPLERQKIAGVTRCIWCQEDFESMEKRGKL